MCYFEKFLKLLLGVLGATLLVAMFERCGPWYMCNIVLRPCAQCFLDTVLQPGLVEFQFPFIRSFKIDYHLVLWLCLALLPATALLFHAVRSSVASLFRHKSVCVLFSLSLAFFVLTFFPVFFLLEKTDPMEMPVCSVALYLMLGLYGVIFFFTGISGYIADFNLWSRLRSFFFTAKLPWFLAILFIVEFLCTNLISYFAFEHIPHIHDSFAQVFQGSIFAHGRLTAPSPPLKELFFYEHIINNGQWYSQYPPGHAFLMMIGILAGAPWIINPLLGSCTIVLFYFLGRELYSDSVGRLASLLGLFSPFILFMSSEFMNHATGLFLFTVFILFYARAVRLQSILSGLIAGTALGWCITIRPLSAIGQALPFIVFACYLLVKRFRDYSLPFFAVSIQALLFTGILLAYNYLTNGDPFLFGYQVLYGNGHLPGFGHAAWGEPHNLAQGISYTLNNFVGLNKYLFEWPLPSLVFVFILFASGRVNRWDVLLLCSFLSLALAYLFYFFQDWCFGPRFLYEASGCLILLTCRGIQSAPHLIKKVFGRPIAVRRIYGFTTAVILFCLSYGLMTNVPALYKLYSGSYWEVNGKIEKAVKQQQIHNAVIFVRHIGFRPPLMANSPFLDNGIIYVWDFRHLRQQIMALYPGYRYYYADHDGSIVELSPE